MRNVKTFSPSLPENLNITGMSSYVSSLQFYPNMRFNHNNLTFMIEDNCNTEKRENMALSFGKLEQETNNLITFYQTEHNPDILVTCNETYILKPTGDFFIAGEGGPERAVKSGIYYVIESGTVILYYTPEKDCMNYNVELHELLHVLGFIHSDNKYSIMYNVSECYQVLTKDITDELIRLYSIPNYPDVSIGNITAIKHGTYLDFEINVKNAGFEKAENIVLGISSKEKEIASFDLEDLEYGEGKILTVENIRIPFSLLSLEQITFSLSIDSKELDYRNNNITMTISE